MPNCSRCGRPVSTQEFQITPIGYCRVCRRLILAQQQAQQLLPQACRRCGRLVSPEEYQRNNGYCDNCGIQAERAAAGPAGTGTMYIHCPHCGTDVNLPSMGANNKCFHCGYRFHPIRCGNPDCRDAQGRHTVVDDHAPSCNRCGWQNPAYVRTAKNLRTTTGKRISGKVKEMIIYEIAGAFVIAGLPFFGLPSLTLLGIVLMALFPFYSFLPDEHEALASRERGVESVGRGWAAGALITKSMVKLLMFILTVLQFTILPISKLIPLAISFVYYISLPSSYKTTQPSAMLEAWLKLAVAGFIAYSFLLAFGFSSQAWSLFWMTLAFFCSALPEHRTVQDNEEQGTIRVNVNLLNRYGQVGQTSQWGIIQKLIFLIFLAIGWFMSGVGIGWGTMQIMFTAVFGLSLFTGITAHPSARPAIGMLMITLTLVVFTFTATGVMGEAVFGYWWPQIASFGESIAEPLAPMLEQVQGGMSDMWLIMTNPMAYYDNMAKKNQAVTSVVKEGGTKKSIELITTSLFTSVNGELEPMLDPLIGSFEIQNQGEFEANRIELKLWATWQDPKNVSATNPSIPTPTGALNIFNCSQPYDVATSGITTETSGGSSPPAVPSSGTLNVGICNWTSVTYPKEIKVVNFVFEKNSWDIGSSGNLAECVNNGTASDCSKPDDTYKYSGQTVKVNVNLTYDYNVNVSIQAEAINQDKYRDFLLAKQITLQEITSQYTGGPVKATLWSQKQPIRSGELSLFVASIVNEGGGILNQIYSFKVLIPKDIVAPNGITIISQTFNKTNGVDGCDSSVIDGAAFPDISNGGNYWVIRCVHNSPIKTGEYKRVSFFITPKDVSDRKTSLLVGLANYEYIKTGSASIKIANNPWH